MSETEAIGLTASLCMRMFGLMLIIAYEVVPPWNKQSIEFVKKQREWFDRKQDMMHIGAMVDDAIGGME